MLLQEESLQLQAGLAVRLGSFTLVRRCHFRPLSQCLGSEAQGVIKSETSTLPSNMAVSCSRALQQGVLSLSDEHAHLRRRSGSWMGSANHFKSTLLHIFPRWSLWSPVPHVWPMSLPLSGPRIPKFSRHISSLAKYNCSLSETWFLNPWHILGCLENHQCARSLPLWVSASAKSESTLLDTFTDFFN